MLQAIVTKIHNPTARRGTIVKATAVAGTVNVPYDHELPLDENHRAAAEKLCAVLNWTQADGYNPLESGTLPDGTYCHVFSPSAKAVLLVRKAMAFGDCEGNPHCKRWGQAVARLTDDEGALSGAYQTFKGL